MKRHILAQGDLDGACFLYSLLNAYISLTSRTPGKQGWDKRFYERWDRAATFVPHLPDFFLCADDNDYSGTGRYNDDPRLYAFVTERVMDKMSTEIEKGRFAVKIHEDATTPMDLKAFVREKSVALVCPNTEHWVACVHCGSNPYTVRVACSWIYHSFDDYQETFHEKNKVYSNDKLARNCEFPFAIQILLD